MKRKAKQDKSSASRGRVRTLPPINSQAIAKNTEPSLAELRRRATERLRKVKLAQAALEREENEALLECERLGAAHQIRTTERTPRFEVAKKSPSARQNPSFLRPESDDAETGGRWRQRTEELQAELKRALTDNARLREDIGRLVNFLDELTGVLQGSPERSK